MIVNEALAGRAADLLQCVELLVSRGSSRISDAETLGILGRLGMGADLLQREINIARTAIAPIPPQEVAHALRNPLTAIIGYSEILIDENDDGIRDELLAIYSGANDILELINRAIAAALVNPPT